MEPQAWPHLSCLKCKVRGHIVCLPHSTRGHHNKDARLLLLTLRWALSSELMEETLRGVATLCPALDRHTHTTWVQGQVLPSVGLSVSVSKWWRRNFSCSGVWGKEPLARPGTSGWESSSILGCSAWEAGCREALSAL